jgi:hypothetical protein
MTAARAPLALLTALLVGAFVGCDTNGPTGHGDLEPASPLFNQGKGGGNNKDKDGTGGDGTVTVTLTGPALADTLGVHEDKNYKESNRQVEISGGPQAATTFAFAGALERYAAGQCIAARGNPDGPALDETTADALAAWLAADVVAGFFMTYDKRGGGLPSDGHDLGFNFTDESGRGVSVAIFAHGDPPPTIHRDGDTFTVSGGVVRVWLRDGPPRNHPKLFCGDHGDRVVLTVER